MRWMSSEIQVGQYVFRNRVSEVTIRHSRKDLTGTAKIKLPNLQGTLKRNIKAGDRVIIKLGYDGRLFEKFRGWVKAVEPVFPYTIHCEDEMWQLKQQPVESVSWKRVTVEEVVKHLVPDVQYRGYDITLSPFRIDRSVKTKAAALQKLKEEFGLDIYYRGDQLFVGLAYSSRVGEITYDFQRNMKKEGVQLEFKRKEDARVKLTLISINDRNEKIEVSGGDESGETHTLHFYNKSKRELEQLLNEHLPKFKANGYKGSFKAFGEPRPLHSMVCNLRDARHPERNGRFFIDAVEIQYSASTGYQHTVELGRRVE